MSSITYLLDYVDFILKKLLACIGKYLEGSGAEEILVQTACFGPDTVKAVMNGGHYNRSKRGLNLLLFLIIGDV